MNNIIETKLFNKMLKDKLVRTSITKNSFLYFLHLYFAHYIKYETADFQKEIIHNLEKSDKENLFIVAFRGSSKSTMVTTAYSIWAILGKQQKKFCVIFCQTMLQAKKHMANLRSELESNDLLKKDLGPFREESEEWGSYSLVFSRNNARITVASTEQSIRGIRHNQYRPDLLICDDVEDIQSTKTREGREKTYNWLKGEVIPAGDRETRLIIVGNLLHEDSLLMRIKKEISENRAKGIFREYPLIDENNNCLWPGKYPTIKEIEEEKMKVTSEISWQREFLLKIMPDDYQVINQEWIQYYDTLPLGHPRYAFTAVDPAMSQKESADYTAMVSAYVYGEGENLRIYILPNPINKRGMLFSEMLERMREFSRNLGGGSHLSRLLIEDVALQAVAQIQTLKSEGYPIEGVKTGGADKRTRLMAISNLVQTGKVLFPRKGTELLIEQIVFFGVEAHDDLADAFSMLLGKIMVEENRPKPGITWINLGRSRQLQSIWDDDDF